MLVTGSYNLGKTDVPRKGNVDRNQANINTMEVKNLTFPARGTWIEI